MNFAQTDHIDRLADKIAKSLKVYRPDPSSHGKERAEARSRFIKESYLRARDSVSCTRPLTEDEDTELSLVCKELNRRSQLARQNPYGKRTEGMRTFPSDISPPRMERFPTSLFAGMTPKPARRDRLGRRIRNPRPQLAGHWFD